MDRLGDPRPGVGLDENGLPDIDWVEIPAGPFIYQDGETRELPGFLISRYPITNRQYQAFVDAGADLITVQTGARRKSTQICNMLNNPHRIISPLQNSPSSPATIVIH